MDKFKAMEAFVRVVDTGSFTRAAELLDSPKATVSTLIRSLEASLGVRLLQRTTRKVTVTVDGAAYYERCVRLIDDMREADEAVSSRQGSPSGRLRVDMPTSIARLLVHVGLNDFLASYPQVSLEMGCSDRVVDLIAEGVDCVIRIGEPSDPGLVARRIGTMHLVTCAAKAYADAHGLPQHPDELHQHQWLNYFMSQSPGRIYPTDFTKDHQRIEREITSALAFNDSNVFEDALRAGLGIGQLPSYALCCTDNQGALIEVMPDWVTTPIPMYILYPSNRHLSTRVQAFVDWVVELFDRTPGLQRH